MKKQQILFVGGIIMVLIVVAVFLGTQSTTTELGETVQQVSTHEPVDIVLDFYGDWLQAANADNTDPYQAGLVDEPLLASTLRTRLSEAHGAEGIDPVLCQPETPTRIASRRVYEADDMVQLLVFSKEPRQQGQSIVTLKRQGEGWYIEDIQCAQESVAADSEYTFEASGVLLKESVPKPFDSTVWHLGYTENDVYVKVVPIILDAESVCVDGTGTESTCDASQFVEVTQVALQGDMTEAGVLVKRLTVLQ